MCQKHLLICAMTAAAALFATPSAYAQNKKAKPEKKPAAEATAEKKPAADAGAAPLDTILKKYVKDGKFGYGQLKASKADMALFKKFMDWQAKADVKAMSREEQIAFYINAYN